MVFENITPDMVGWSPEIPEDPGPPVVPAAPAVPGDPAIVIDLLNTYAAINLIANSSVKALDGEIVPTNQFQYGVHYNLGDIIETQGNSGVVQASRVTEYIRAQDEAGERAYPTVTALD